MDNFFEKNILNKIPMLQDEHKKVLREIYQDAVKKNCIHEFQFDKYLSQSMKYTDIKNNCSKMDDTVLCVCLSDLEGLGFLVNTMRNPYKEMEYAISYLGMLYIKIHENIQ